MKQPADIIFHPVHFLSLGLGSGLSPKAPGTAGTVVAVGLYYPLSSLPTSSYIAVLLLSIVVGVFLCDKTSNALGVPDHPAIVWDEFAGFWLTMLFVPSDWYWVLAGFLLFRLFDIWKPWPIRVIDHKVKGGFGIMLDDLVAGGYALVCLHLLIYSFA